MAKVILTDAIINEMSIREINRHFRNEDESDKWFCIFVFNAGKISPVDFFPCWLHCTDGLQHVIVWLTCQLGNLQTAHRLPYLRKVQCDRTSNQKGSQARSEWRS